MLLFSSFNVTCPKWLLYVLSVPRPATLVRYYLMLLQISSSSLFFYCVVSVVDDFLFTERVDASLHVKQKA